MANNFQIYASNLNYVYTDDATYTNSAFRQSGGVPNNTASAYAVNTALYCASLVCKCLIDAMIANTSDVASYGIDDAATLTTNLGGMLSNLNVKTATKWATIRNITISDADGTNSGMPIQVDGSSDVTLKLPQTIKGSLIGTASNASNINNKSFNMTYDSSTGTLDITYR